MSAPPHPPDATGTPTDPAQALAQACRALWLATLSLMTAFMQATGPAHRLLLARRISGNLRTLHAQPCFSAEDQRRFARLATRWEGHALHWQAVQEGRSSGRLARVLKPLFGLR
jgi:hypothetical protein